MSVPSSRCRSTVYCCTRGALRVSSTKLMLVPAPASRPRLLPDGGTSPFGNGLVIVTVGVTVVCGAGVTFEKPIAPYELGLGAGEFHGDENIPYPARRTAF